MPDFADDTSTELERKARALQWVSVLEAMSYAILLGFMIARSSIGVRVVGSVHGLVVLGFAAMVLMIAGPMRWSWRWVVAVLVTGPIGAILVYERIRRHGVPAPVGS